MIFTIRECEIEDYRAIVKLNKEELKYDYSEDATRVQLDKLLQDRHHKIYVAVSKEQVVGYIHAQYYDVLYAPHMKDIIGIAVCNSFKKQGIGKALLKQVEAWGKATGASGVRLVSGAHRLEAHAFYQHCGYIASKEQKNFKKIFEC